MGSVCVGSAPWTRPPICFQLPPVEQAGAMPVASALGCSPFSAGAPPGLAPAVVTQVQQQIWSQGDFAQIGTAQQIVAEELCEAIDVMPGSRLLDVACGGGNGAIAGARRKAQAVGLDYVPGLLE